MKAKILLIALIVFALVPRAQAQLNFYNYSWPTIAGDTISMSQYAGKKLMVVNVASFCAYTPQYAPLSQLDSLYAARYNFAIIGFPCDDFGNQGGRDSVIVATCNTYHVHFQIMAKVKIIAGDTAPVYKWLQRGDLNGVASEHVTWNFNKFLIDRQGNWVRWFDSNVDPLDTAIVNWIVADSASINTGVQTVNASEDAIHIRSANPATSDIMLNVKSENAQKVNIDLYTTDGRQVAQIFSGNVSGELEIEYSAAATLPAGMYLIKASGETFEKTLKCVIQH
jgi:glutathione peroxidase